MKIWLVNPYGPIPGESWRDYSFTMMCEALADAGHEVVWWTSNFSHHFKSFRSKGWEDRSIAKGITLRLVPTTSYKSNIGIGRIIRDSVFALRAYRRGKKMEAPDCIVYSESPLTFGYAGQKLAEFHGVPKIFDQMDLWPELFEKAFPVWIRWFIRLILLPVYMNRRSNYKKLDGVMALAEPYLEAAFNVAPILRSRPHELVYNGVDVESFRFAMKKSDGLLEFLPDKNGGDLWAVFAGSLGPSYDIPTLINVARQLEKINSSVRIIIAGDGPYASEIKRFHAENGGKYLLYVGKLSPEQLVTLYGMCDIGINAYSKRSNVEMPDKIYDYTAAGLPVINSLCGEVSRIIDDNNIGFQYQAEDYEDLLNALQILEKDNVLRMKMAENSLRLGSVFDKNVQYKKFVCLVEKIGLKKI